MSITGDKRNDYSFTRILLQCIFEGWPTIPTQKDLKKFYPEYIDILQKMLKERIEFYSQTPGEFVDRSNQQRISKMISDSIYLVNADVTNEE